MPRKGRITKEAPSPLRSVQCCTTEMSTESSPKRESTPSSATPLSSIPQKRVLEDDHQPAVSSPLNPDFKATKIQDDAPRAPRAKKETLKKREAKGGSLADTSARATPDPKGNGWKNKKKVDAPSPMRYKLPPPKSTDFEAPRGPIFVPSHTKIGPDGEEIQFNESTEHVHNKRGYYYAHCIADPAFPLSFYYRSSEAEPFKARLNFEDTSTHMFLDDDGQHITTDKGFRMAKANVGVREGRWYYECKITSGIPKRKRDGPEEPARGHVRMGWARREATLDAPVGYDAYSYGIRDVDGQKMFMSRPKDFFPPGEDIREGDIIGLEINLPSENLHRKVVEGQYNKKIDMDEDSNGIERADIIRDRVPIRFKAHLYFETVDYHTSKELEDLMHPSTAASSTHASSEEPNPTHSSPALRTLPHSSIKIYKNGELIGTPFTDLLAFLPPASKPMAQPGVAIREGLDDGMLGYYPAISVFRGGAAEVNFGPKFWYPPSGYEENDEVDMIGSDQPIAPKLQKLRAAGERYDEQIVEDILYDIVDEVDFWVQDGCHTGKEVKKAGVPVGLAGGVVGGEIKELVQDDE